MGNQTVPAVSDLPDWLDRVFDHFESEGTTIALTCSLMLKLNGRQLVWYICEKFDRLSHGLPGQTCRIMERFIAFIHQESVYEGDDSSAMVTTYVKPRLMLIAANSLQLAAKMYSSRQVLTARTIRAFLALEGCNHTIHDITQMELNILGSLGFRVPLMTCVEVGEMMADAVAVEPQVLPVVAKIIDLVELYRFNIEKVIRWTAQTRGLNNWEARVRTMHLVGGCVAASVKAASSQRGVSEKLAAKLKLPIGYIKCMRDVILGETADARSATDKPTYSGKRKHTGDDDDPRYSPRPCTSSVTY